MSLLLFSFFLYIVLLFISSPNCHLSDLSSGRREDRLCGGPYNLTIFITKVCRHVMHRKRFQWRDKQGRERKIPNRIVKKSDCVRLGIFHGGLLGNRSTNDCNQLIQAETLQSIGTMNSTFSPTSIQCVCVTESVALKHRIHRQPIN